MNFNTRTSNRSFEKEVNITSKTTSYGLHMLHLFIFLCFLTLILLLHPALITYANEQTKVNNEDEIPLVESLPESTTITVGESTDTASEIEIDSKTDSVEEVSSIELNTNVIEEEVSMTETIYISDIAAAFPNDPNAEKNLLQIGCAEARGESIEVMVAVYEVILNRCQTEGATPTAVILSPKQFSPVRDGSFYRTYSPQEYNKARIALLRALNGEKPTGGALYFNNRGLRCWASRNRRYATTIGKMDFYY